MALPHGAWDGLQCLIVVFPDYSHLLYYISNEDFQKKKYNKISKGTKIRNRYNQVPHLTRDTNEKVTNSQKAKTPTESFYPKYILPFILLSNDQSS